MGKRIYLAMIWVITLVCIGIGCSRYVFSFSWGFWGEKKYEYVEDFDTSMERTAKSHGEKGKHEYEQTFTNLMITCETADITIKKGSVLSCEYKVPSGTEYSFDWKPDNEGTAYITQTNNNVRNSKECSFVITIPSDMTLSHLLIQNNVGDTKISGVSVDSVSVMEDVGDFEMKETYAGDVEVEAHTGDVEFEHTVFANLTVNCDLGDCSVENVDLGDYNLDLSTSVGEIEVNDVTHYSHYVLDNMQSKNIHITCNMGDVEIN